MRNGTIKKNPIRQVVDLDSLPIPDYSLFDPKGAHRTINRGDAKCAAPIETHRGCPYTCTFCNSPRQTALYRSEKAGKYFRIKSLDRVFKELKHVKENHDVEYIFFTADTFLTMSDSYMNEFAERYQEIGLPFWCETRPETLDKKRVGLLEKMGCYYMAIGIEHGNEYFRRNVLKRKYTNQELITAFKSLEGSSIKVSTNNIVGFPEETRDLTWDTIWANRKLQHILSHVNAFHYVPYHGTPMRQYALDKKYLDKDTELCHITKDTVLNMPQYTRNEIKGVIRTFGLYMKFPESDFGKITAAEKLTREGNQIFAELREVFFQKYCN